MKTLTKLCVVLLLLLIVLTACDLYNQVNVGRSMDAVIWSSPTAQVHYTVWNQGKYDLTGVNLKIGVDVGTPIFGYVSAWTTPDFDLAKNETRSGDIYINIPSGVPTTAPAAVLAVDMDNPKD